MQKKNCSCAHVGHGNKLGKISLFTSFKPLSAMSNKNNVCGTYFILKCIKMSFSKGQQKFLGIICKYKKIIDSNQSFIVAFYIF